MPDRCTGTRRADPVDDAVGGELVDDQADEPDLVDGEPAAVEIAAEGLGRSLTGEPDEGADEQPEPLRLLCSRVDVGLPPGPADEQHLLSGARSWAVSCLL